MSEIVQLYKDEQKTTKVYPKTVATEVYIDENTTVASQLEQKKIDKIRKITNGTMSILSGQLNLNEIPSIINAASDTQLETKETEPKWKGGFPPFSFIKIVKL